MGETGLWLCQVLFIALPQWTLGKLAGGFVWNCGIVTFPKHEMILHRNNWGEQRVFGVVRATKRMSESNLDSCLCLSYTG